MKFIQTKIESIRQKLALRGFEDPRMIGLLVLAFIGLSFVWNGVKVVQQNYGLLQKIAVLEEENRILEIQNSNKIIQNEYYETPEFAELKARRVNGKAAPGESVYVITDEVALNSLKTPEQIPQSENPKGSKPTYQQNFEAWVDFFFGG